MNVTPEFRLMEELHNTIRTYVAARDDNAVDGEVFRALDWVKHAYTSGVCEKPLPVDVPRHTPDDDERTASGREMMRPLGPTVVPSRELRHVENVAMSELLHAMPVRPPAGTINGLPIFDEGQRAPKADVIPFADLAAAAALARGNDSKYPDGVPEPDPVRRRLPKFDFKGIAMPVVREILKEHGCPLTAAFLLDCLRRRNIVVPGPDAVAKLRHVLRDYGLRAGHEGGYWPKDTPLPNPEPIARHDAPKLAPAALDEIKETIEATAAQVADNRAAIIAGVTKQLEEAEQPLRAADMVGELEDMGIKFGRAVPEIGAALTATGRFTMFPEGWWFKNKPRPAQ